MAAQSLVRAVREGQLTEARLDALGAAHPRDEGAPGPRPKPPGGRGDRGPERGPARGRGPRPGDGAGVDHRGAQREAPSCPCAAEGPLKLLHLVLSSDAKNPAIQGIPEEELRARRVAVENVSARTGALGGNGARRSWPGRPSSATWWPRVSCGCTGSQGNGGHGPRATRACCAPWPRRGGPSWWCRSGAPTCCASSPRPRSTSRPTGRRSRASVPPSPPSSASIAVGGKLPVTLPGLYAYGHGLELPRREMTLRTAARRRRGSAPTRWAEADRGPRRGPRCRSARFRGRVLAVGKDGALVHRRAFGRLTYGRRGAPFAPGHALRPGQPHEGGRHHDDGHDPGGRGAARPRQAGSSVRPRLPGRGARTGSRSSSSLTHSSGLDWWAAALPGYGRARRPTSSRSRPWIWPTRRARKSLYSDLGVILLGEVLERVAGEPLDAFARRRVLRTPGHA